MPLIPIVSTQSFLHSVSLRLQQNDERRADNEGQRWSLDGDTRLIGAGMDSSRARVRVTIRSLDTRHTPGHSQSLAKRW